MRVLINGSRGRMGQALVQCSKDFDALSVGAEVDTGDDFIGALQHCEAVIDFSHHAIIESVLTACVASHKTLVIGTTGHSDAQIAAIHAAGKQIPIVFAPNYSVGVNTLFWLTQKATEILGTSFDLEVVEMHHRLKKDSPSGTARRLAEILTEVRGLDYTKDVLHGREGLVGQRTNTEIGMHAIRGGDVVGDHTVIYANVGERVELTHKASSRDTFAKGALRASVWVLDKKPGLYDMEDVLGLR